MSNTKIEDILHKHRDNNSPVYSYEQVMKAIAEIRKTEGRGGMKKLEIYQFQAAQIEDTFRIVARVQKSTDKLTCLDRDIMVSWKMIKNVLEGNIDEFVKR